MRNDGSDDFHLAKPHYPTLDRKPANFPPPKASPGTPYAGPRGGVRVLVSGVQLHTGGGIVFLRYWVVAMVSTTDGLLIEIFAWIRGLVRRKPESCHHDQGPPDLFGGF